MSNDDVDPTKEAIEEALNLEEALKQMFVSFRDDFQDLIIKDIAGQLALEDCDLRFLGMADYLGIGETSPQVGEFLKKRDLHFTQIKQKIKEGTIPPLFS